MKTKIFLTLSIVGFMMISCQKDEGIVAIGRNEVAFKPIFKEYNPSSVEGVMEFMDSLFFHHHFNSGGGYVLSGVFVLDSIGSNQGRNVKFGHCISPFYSSCNIIYNSEDEYSWPCSNLMAEYQYDTTMLNKDFAIICETLSPTFYQGLLSDFRIDYENFILSYIFQNNDIRIEASTSNIVIEDL